MKIVKKIKLRLLSILTLRIKAFQTQKEDKNKYKSERVKVKKPSWRKKRIKHQQKVAEIEDYYRKYKYCMEKRREKYNIAINLQY